VALARKYKGIRLYDDGDREAYRVRRDRAEFAGKKQGGWALLCDKMPPISPASDPEGDCDYAFGGEKEPEKQIIREALHNMISQAEQAPGVRLVGPGASDEEEKDEEEKDEEGKE
jgi:hypothetical protein